MSRSFSAGAGPPGSAPLRASAAWPRSTVLLLRDWLQSAQEPLPGLRPARSAGGAGGGRSESLSSCQAAGSPSSAKALNCSADGAGTGRSPVTPGLSAPSPTHGSRSLTDLLPLRSVPGAAGSGQHPRLGRPEPSAPGWLPHWSFLGWGLLVFRAFAFVFVFTLRGFLIPLPHLEQPLAIWRKAASCHSLPHLCWGSGWLDVREESESLKSSDESPFSQILIVQASCVNTAQI